MKKFKNIKLRLLVILLVLIYELIIWLLDVDMIIFNFLLAVIYILGYCSYIYYISNKSKNWLTTEGVITKSTYEYQEHGDSGGYTRIVNYVYQVGDKVFTSNKIDFGIVFHDLSADLAFQRDEYKFKQGQKVKVYYHPKNFEKSILIPGPQPSLIIPIWVSLCVLLVFILIYFDLV